LADVVLTAADPGEEEPLGMVTATAANDSATIGLIAVAEQKRGRGWGRRLMRAAHRWMRDRGAVSATVTTQLANHSACRLYESCGYHLHEVRHWYHFWPTETEGILR
jgi:GNAT superfamily N-acetyltransferase